MRLLLGVVLISAMCGSRQRTRHIYVPKSSGACWRECKAIEATCNSKTNVYVGAGRVNVGGSDEGECAEHRKDCLLSCPGAREEWWVDGKPESKYGPPDPNEPD